MLWVCKRYVNDMSLAEDLMHEGFITAMQKQNTFSGFGSFEGWLRTIMVNNCLMYLRKSKSNLFVSDSDIPDTTTASAEMNPTYDNKSKIINTDFSQQELLEVVEAIPEHHKIVFNMYVIDKFSHNEISKTLNITTNTSKSHLLRARKKIQELLLAKADEKEQKKDRRKLFFWFLFPSCYIDSLYAKGFSSSNETPVKPFDIEDVIRQYNLSDRITSGFIFGITYQKIAVTISIALLLCLFFLFSNNENHVDENKTGITVSSSSAGKTSINPTTAISAADSLRSNRTNGSSTANTKNRIDRSDKNESAATTTSPKTVDKPKKQPHEKKENKPPVVIKKIIDTVYVYK